MTTTTIGTGSDTLTFGISEDAYLGDAQFTVSVDNQQIGGVLTATSLHNGSVSDVVNVLGNWGIGAHTATVNFLNDAWGGTLATDRNLYIDGAAESGVFIPRAAQALDVNGPASFIFGGAPSTGLPAAAEIIVTDTNGRVFTTALPFPLATTPYYASATGLNQNLFLYSNGAGGWIIAPSSTYNAPKIVLAANGNPIAAAGFSSSPSTVTWSSGTTKASAISPILNAGDTLTIKSGATVLAEGSQLAGVGIDLDGEGAKVANLTLTSATVGSLIAADPDVTHSSTPRYGHLDVYGQSTVTGGITIGGDKPIAPGFLDAYVHGSDGVFALHGVVTGGASTLTIKGDAGSAVENDGTITIRGGANTGSVTILDDLKGTGTISGSQDNGGDPAGVHLGGSVGAGQTINLTQTSLLLDKPMSFQGTLAGFNAARLSGVTLSNEDVTSATYAQSAPGVGTLSLATQDPTSGVAGATLAFHVAGDYAGKTFAFTNDAAGHSAFVTLAA